MKKVAVLYIATGKYVRLWPEITVEIGMANRGKYTLLKMLEFVVNVPDTLLMQDEKKPHSAVPAR